MPARLPPRATRSLRHGRSWWPALALAAALTTLLCSCVVPAPEADLPDPEMPVLQIVRSKLVPEPVDELELEVQNAASRQEFSVAGAIDARFTRSPLYFHWYYDWQTGDPLLPVCFQSQQVCTLYPCQALGTSEESHTMLLMVADAPIGTDAASPYDFPDDVAWDAVLWQVRYQGSCP